MSDSRETQTCSGFACEYADKGMTRCPSWRCDCFIEQFPDTPRALHPEAFIVLSVAPGEPCPVGQEEEWSREFGACPGCAAVWPDLHVYTHNPLSALCVKCGWATTRHALETGHGPFEGVLDPDDPGEHARGGEGS